MQGEAEAQHTKFMTKGIKLPDTKGLVIGFHHPDQIFNVFNGEVMSGTEERKEEQTDER